MDPLLEFLLATSISGATTQKLRVGILLAGQRAPEWVVHCVEETAALPFVDLECLEQRPRTTARGSLLYCKLLERSCQRFDTKKHATTEQKRTPISCDDAGHLSADSAALIEQRQFDVLFAPQPGLLKGSCRGLARYGVWSVALDGILLQDTGQQFFRVGAQGKDTFSMDLTVHHDTWEEGWAFLRYKFPAEPGMWFTRNARPLEGLGSIFAISLLIVHRQGKILGSGEDTLDSAVCAPASEKTTSFAVMQFMLAKFIRSVQLIGRDGGPGRWFIAYAYANSKGLPKPGETAKLQRFQGFPGHEAADPFLANQNGKTYVFFEDMPPPTRKGRLAVQEISPVHELPAAVIMEAPGHLSYPCVFQHAGEWYMIPESAATRTVDLFRATEFPQSWEKIATLAAGPELVDTTPLLHNGLWYFFTTAELAGSWKVNLLFTSENLCGPWRSHPASPLSVDSTACRGAGNIFRDGKRLIRAVQDCSRQYGGSVVLNEILELTQDSFRERPVGRIDPNWQRGLRATHTWNRVGQLEILDGRA